MSPIIAITNQKGGVGKTTTTLNLGVWLARHRQRVLLIDADPQGSLTVSMGVRNLDELDVSLATVLQATVDSVDLPRGTGIFHHTEGGNPPCQHRPFRNMFSCLKPIVLVAYTPQQNCHKG